MSKKYTAKELHEILDTIIIHTVSHMALIERELVGLQLKGDGSDAPEKVQKAQVYNLLLTMLNDAIHSSHTYCSRLVVPSVLDRYIKNQKQAFENKLVNPCGCFDCKKRGYNYAQEHKDIGSNQGINMEMAGSADASQRSDASQENQSEN